MHFARAVSTHKAGAVNLSGFGECDGVNAVRGFIVMGWSFHALLLLVFGNKLIMSTDT